MAHVDKLKAQNPAVAPEEAAVAAPVVVRTGKPEEGEASGEGWVAMRSLLLVVGGMALVSYLIFSF